MIYEGLHTQLSTPFGTIELIFSHEHLIRIHLQALSYPHPVVSHDHCALIKDTVQQFKAYFKNPNHTFSINYLLQTNTPYQQRIIESLMHIPCGKVRSYGDVSKDIGGSALAVGGACKRNPLPLLFPCHRIVAKNHLGGYGGQRSGPMLAVKQWLLEHEGFLKK